MARRRALGVAVALLVGSGAALARDLAAEPPYPIAPPPEAARPEHRPAAERPVPLPPRRAVLRPEGQATVAVPLPKAAPVQPAARPPAPPPQLAALPPSRPAPESAPPGDAAPKTYGWTVLTDPATGIRLGLPMELAPLARDAAHGTRWTSRHGEVQLETFRLARSELTLAAVFEQMKHEPASRKVDSSTLRDDGFVINGIQGLKTVVVRAEKRDGEVRGLTVSYDQAMEGIVGPLLPAIANAFTPFPDRPAPFAVLSRSVDYGSGVIVSARGDIVTAARLAEGCQVLSVSGLGDAERIAEDRQQGFAVLRVYGRRDLPAAALSGSAQPGEVTLAGIPDPREQTGRAAIMDVKARLGAGGIELLTPAPMAGLRGAAALDAQGRLAGIADWHSVQVASRSPAAAPVRLIPAAAIRNVLAAQGVTPPAPGGDAKRAVVRIICVRK